MNLHAAFSCQIGFYTDGRIDDAIPETIMAVTGYTQVHILDIATFDFTQVDVFMLNVASNNGPSEDLLGRLAFLELWVREGGKIIIHDRSAGNAGNSLLINLSSTSLIRNTNTLINLEPYGTKDNALIQGENGSITETSLQNTNGFAVASTLPSTAIKYLVSAEDINNVAAFIYPLGEGYIYYSGIPLDYYFRQTGSSQPGANYRTIYTPNLLDMICLLNIQTEPDPQPGDTCSTAQNLAEMEGNPFKATTTGYLPDFYNYCGNYAPDRIFYIDVPEGYKIEIQQTSNTYDSQHSMRYGGHCPGTHKIVCVNDTDTRLESWLNLTGEDQTVYWINGAYYRDDHGDFWLKWQLTKPDIYAVWTGNVSNNWNDPGNWDINYVPNEMVGVTIPGLQSNYPELNGQLVVNSKNGTFAHRCRQLTIEQGGLLTTNNMIVNYGIIQINGGTWNHQDNHEESIILEEGSLLEINDGKLSCGDAESHDQTDLIVKTGGKLIVNAGTLEITDRLVVSNGAHFTAISGHVSIGTYTGILSESSHTLFEIGGGHSIFYVDQATIEVKRSGDCNNPGLWFHEYANISLNHGTFVFSNASDQTQTLYANFNGHVIPKVMVQLSDNSHELILCNAQSTMGQLTITRGALRLNGSHLLINGNASPAITIGNDSGVLLVDSGTIEIPNNQPELTAIQVLSGGKVEVQTNGVLDRRLSIAESFAKVIHINNGGEFDLNGGTVYLDNQHAEYAWGVTVDSGGLFSMTSGSFHNDAAMHCYGELRFQGGTFHVAAQTDETQSVFNVYENATIYAQHTRFDSFSMISGQPGIHVYNKASVGTLAGDDNNDFDGCTFQNWHPQGQALTVDNTESFTITSAIFESTGGNNISKESTGTISVTNYDGNRSGESFDAEPEGCTRNHVHWDNTVRLSGKNHTGTALKPANEETRYYAANSNVHISGRAENGESILWIIEPTGATIPESGESTSHQITLLKDCQISWYSGTAGKWLGLNSSQWRDASNWADHKIPTITTHVSIDSDCSNYPVLHESLSIHNDQGFHQCMSISLSSGATITTHANVYCYSLIDLQQASWQHLNASRDAFQIHEGGKLLINNATFNATGLQIDNDGQLEINDSTVNLSYGIHNHFGKILVSNSTLYFGKADDLDDVSFKVAGSTLLDGKNSSLIFQGDAGASKPCIQLHESASISLDNTNIIFQLRENQETMHANFASKVVDKVYIRMPKDTQTLKLIDRNAQMNHLFVQNGIFDINGMTLSLLGDNTTLTIGNENHSKAMVKMASGKISVTNNASNIAMHLIDNGHFLMSGGTFEINLENGNSLDKTIWVETGTFEQTGGAVEINNQAHDSQWPVWVDRQGIFKLSDGTFQNDGRITCSGMIDLDGGTIKMQPNTNIFNALIHVLDDGTIEAQHTRFQNTGVQIDENASIGTDPGDDNDDFDRCIFEDWSGSALTFNNSESFTISNPSFTNTAINITKQTTGKIDITGAETGTHGGEAYDSDPEGSPINIIHWENTRTLIAESATAKAISPTSSQTVYYASETTARATGQLLTGSVINWVIEPLAAASPGTGESSEAEFTIKEDAKITWYSGNPGHWTGRTSSEWTNPENWSDHRIPTNRFDVLISSNSDHYPVLDTPLYINSDSGTIQCRSLSIEDGATLTVRSTVMAYSKIEIHGHWIQETNSDNAIQLFAGAQLILNNATFVINHTSNDMLTDVLIHPDASVKLQQSDLITQGRILNNGSIEMNQGSWHILNDFDNAIALQAGSLMMISGGNIFCGDATTHSQTDLLIDSEARLTINDATIAIVDALKNNGDLIATDCHIKVGTYEGSETGNSETRFDMQENASFTLNNAIIEIKSSTDKSHPGLYFHHQASITINDGEILFSNASQSNLYAIPNNHDLPLVTVDLIDVSHEVIFADSNHQMKQLVIKQGTLRLDNNIIHFTGSSPAIKIGDNIGNNDARLIVEKGELQINQNVSSLQALLVQSDGRIDIQPEGRLERQLSIDDSLSNVIYIKEGGEFYLNGGSVTLDNAHSSGAWGMAIDDGGLFQMDSGTFNNDASVNCRGLMRFLGGTFNLVSQTDESGAYFHINTGAKIEARDTTFDHFSQASGLPGIHVYNNAYIGSSSGDDDFDFDGCIFKSWHLQGVALTVDNSESFTISNPKFENADGNSITTTTALIVVTGSNLGSRGGEAFDAEFEGSTHNKINWPDTISLYGKKSTAQALHPMDGTFSYYAANTRINISGQTINGPSLLWEITPSGASIPESGERSSAEITLLTNSVITWYSGHSGLWTGDKSSVWAEKGNWHDHKIPDPSIDVIIPDNCNHYPILNEPLSIGGINGVNQCKSLVLQSGATLTTQASVFCYSLVQMTNASWDHTANQMNAFQIFANGQFKLDASELKIGHEAPLSGLIINSDGKFLAGNNSTVQISHGFQIQSNASVEISKSQLVIGWGKSLTDPIWTIADHANVQLHLSMVKIAGCANIDDESIQFHTNATVVFNSTPIYVELSEPHDIFADFGDHSVNDIHIQMSTINQSLKLDTNNVQVDHLFIENGRFNPNGKIIYITGNDTAIVIGDDHPDKEAWLEMSSGRIEITGQSPDICAMHIYQNGFFSMAGGTFSRNMALNDSFDKVLWIEGTYHQSDGTVSINNQNDNEHWSILIDTGGTFQLSGGLFQNDSRIRCHANGLMDLDGGQLIVSSSKTETESGFEILAHATIQARNTIFSQYCHSSAKPGINVNQYAKVGTLPGDDDDDFDHCQFKDWYSDGYALSFSNGESFTITNPTFNNSEGQNIYANKQNIYVTGTAMGNRWGEQFDCDQEGSAYNYVHWENTRKLVGKDGTALAISPSMNETYYYGKNTIVTATGRRLTGTALHWHIIPPEAATPSKGDGDAASFTMNESADIFWYSGFPGLWTGEISSEWHNPGNWSDHEVPDHTIDVTIHDNVPNDPILNEPLYVNASEGTCQCRSLKLLKGATLTTTSRIIAYSAIEINEATWLQETNENEAIVLNNGSHLSVIASTLTIGQANIDPQVCIKINHGGVLQVETGIISIADRLHVQQDGEFQMSGGKMMLGTESHALSQTNGTPDSSGLLQVDSGGRMNISGGTIEFQANQDQIKALRLDMGAHVNVSFGELFFNTIGSSPLNIYADFGEHEVYQVRVKLGQADHCLLLSDHDAWFNALNIQKGQFKLNSQTLSFKGEGPSIIIGDQSDTDDAALLLTHDETILVNQAIADVKVLFIQDDGQFLMSGGELIRDVWVEDDFDAVIHVSSGGLYEQTGGNVMINNQSSNHYWGIRIDDQANFNLLGGMFKNDARTWCFGNMHVMNATYVIADSEHETQAIFSVESTGNIHARDAVFSHIFTEQGILIKAGARIGQSPGDDDFDFDQCEFTHWNKMGSALTVENTESFTMVNAVFENSGGTNITKQSAGQIRVIGLTTGTRGGERYDSDVEGGLTNYIHWDNTASLTGQSISGMAIRPASQQKLYFMSGSEISATGQGFPLSWEITPSDSVSITMGENSPATFILNDHATIKWYSIKPGMWRGLVSSNWHDPMNWDDGTIPTETDEVTIPYTFTHAPIINEPAICGHLTMKQTSQLTLQSSLTITGHLHIEPDAQLNNGNTTLEIHGDWHNEGMFNAQTGTVVLSGYSNCQMTQRTDQPFTFHRLIIDKQTPAVLSFGDVNIQNELILKTGIPHFTSQLTYAPNARLTYAGNQNQTIGTELSSTPLPSVIHINSEAGVHLSTDLTLHDTLLFTKGYLILDDYDLRIQENAVVEGAFSNRTSIVTNGSGALIVDISQPDTLFFPVGSVSAQSGFAPFTIIFHEGVFNAGQVFIQTVNDRPVENISVSNYADQYWQVSSSGITSYSCTVQADLDHKNIQGESLYFGRWDGQNWYILDPMHEQTPKFSGKVNALGLFTAGEYNTFASRIILSGYMDHFCGVQTGGVSVEKNYVISGYNLLDDIMIIPPEQFEISTDSETGYITYPQQLRIPSINSQLPETQIFVRFRPSGTGSVQKDILHTSKNAETTKALASGSGLFIRTITLSAPTPSDNMQVKLVFDPEVFEYDHVLDDGADIRFRKGSQNLSYWIQKWNPEGESIIWVRVPDSDVSAFDMEYGKEAIPSASNGNDTFVLFDDFSGNALDAEKWQTKNISTTINNGSLVIRSQNDSGGMSSIQSFDSTDTYSYAAVYKASLDSNNVFTLFGFSAGADPWLNRTGIYGYLSLNRFGKQNEASSTSHDSNKAIALYDENIVHLITVALNQGFGFDDNYIEFDGAPPPTVHAAISTYELGGNSTVDWMFVYKNASPAIIATIGAECNMPGGGIWLGSVSSDWSNPQNWNTRGVPKGSDNVLIGPGCPNMPRLSSTANCKNIEIKRNAFLNLSNYQLNVYGEWKNSGTLIPQNGAVCFRGSIDVDASGLGPETQIVGDVNHTQRYDYHGFYYLGYKFKITEDITVFSLRSYFGTRVSLWNDSGALLATVTSNNSGGQWKDVALSEPVTLTENESYILAAYTGGKSYYLSTSIESSFPNGKIQESRISSGDRFPETLSSIQWWMVDLVYKTGSGTGFENFHQLIVQKTGDHYVELRNVHIENRLTMKSGNLRINNLLTYSSDAALEYAVDTDYITAQEFPISDGPFNLIINGTGDVHLDFDRQIDGRLTLAKGKLYLGSQNLSFGPDASVKITGNSFLVTEDTGNIRQYINDVRSCKFPLGYTNLMPLTLDIQSAQIEDQAYIDVRLQKEPYAVSKPLNALTPLNRYWQIKQTGISDMLCHIHAVYADDTIPKTANEKYFMGDYKNDDQWISLGRVNLQTNSFEGPATDPQIISAYEYALANQLPSGKNKTISIMENEFYPFTETDFGFSDLDPYDTFKAIRISRLPDQGRLIFQNQDVNHQQVIDVSLVNQIIFTPDSFESGLNYASFDFQVQDSDFGWSETSYSITVDVIRINKAPEINRNGPIQQRISEDLDPLSWSAPYIAANDPDGDPMTWILITPPEHGIAYIEGLGAEPAAFQYTPDANYHGNDQWVIGVQDTAIEPLSDTIVVEVIIESVNDAPGFKCEPSQLSLDEDFVGSVNIQIIPDPIPENEISEEIDYYITPETNGIFDAEINEQTQKLTINAIKDKHGVVRLEIAAKDYQLENSVARQTLPITIIAVNDPPLFELDQTALSVNEDFTQTYVVHVDPEPVPHDEIGQSVHYYLSSTQIEFVNLSINADTGELSITSIPDANGTGKVEIWADDLQSENNLAHRSLFITVLPVNDPPSFHLDKTYIRLEQDFQETITITPHVEMMPVDEQSEKPTFNISPSVLFANVNIDAATGIITISSISNKTGNATFVVTADDGQLQNNTASSSFELKVLEKMPPLTIQLTQDIVTLDEDFTHTEMIQAIVETDTNHPNRSASFSLSPTQIDFANIAIDSEAGTITINSLPDQNGIQEFTVIAVDELDPEVTAMDTFVLEINSINDPPDFQLSENIIHCQENQLEPIIIDIIPTPTPQDESAQSVTYSVTPMDSDLLEIRVNALQKTIQIRPKHNQNGVQILTVIANENASIFAESIQQISVTVLDVNSPPIFEMSSQSIYIPEDFETTTLSIIPMEQPPDEQAQEVSYHISSEPLDFIQIHIDEQTGKLTFESIKDLFGEATLTLTAHESMVDENADYSQQIDITVYPVNDPPTFHIDQSSIELIEDFSSTVTVTITPDTPPLNESDQQVTYRLSPKTVAFADISIDESSGAVSINSLKDLNGEADISIIADDHSDSNNQSSKSFHLVVSAENDPPNFTLSQNAVSFHEDFSGTKWIHVTPNDIASDEADQTLNYSINPTWVDFVNIKIDPVDGSIQISSKADKHGYRQFKVIADDRQNENNIAFQYLDLTVTSVNDPPVFSLSETEIVIQEDCPTATIVNIIPKQLSADESEPVSYYLTPKSVDFVDIFIDSNSNKIHIQTIPDQIGDQFFTITADDHQQINDTAQSTFRVSVEPLNDPPTFTLEQSSVNLLEDFHTPLTVNVIMGETPDDEQDQVITYKLDPQDSDLARLSINENSGQLIITSLPNANGSQNITIIANDHQSISNTFAQTLILNITPVNDIPIFKLEHHEMILDEDFSGIETLSWQMIDVPKDELSQTIDFHLSPSTCNFVDIQIDPESSWISFQRRENRNGSARFLLVADDGQHQNAQYAYPFDIVIRPVNDAPAFALSAASLTVVEDFEGDKKIEVIPMNIPDDEADDMIRYALSPTETPFAFVHMNEMTGEITFRSNNNEHGTQTFKVIAKDYKDINSEYEQELTLTVLPVNDPPVFTLSRYAINVEEDFSGQQNILVIPGLTPSNEDGQTVTYSLNPPSVDFARININAETGFVTIQSLENGSGSQMISVIANDGQAENNIEAVLFSLTVAPINDPPAFQLSKHVLDLYEDFTETQVIECHLDPIAVDEKNQVIQFSYQSAPPQYCKYCF
jgi:hypothetical protein